MISKMSNYFLKLQTEDVDVAERYRQKLLRINNVDPFALDDSSFSVKPCDFPPVTSIDIVSYLVCTTSYYTNKQMKAYKSLTSFKYFEAGFVNNCGALKIADSIIVAGKVKHSQRLNDPPLKVWIICNEDGSIETAHCTCMAGLGEVCSHVGALLYAVEFIVTARQNTSCTDVRSLWNVPTVKKVDYQQVKGLAYKRIVKFDSTLRVPCLNDEQQINFITEVEEAGCSTGLLSVVEPFCSKVAEELNLHVRTIENPLAQLYRDEFENYTLEELRILSETVSLTISQEDCDKVKEITVNQSDSMDWFTQRIGRITASNFKRVTRTSLEKPSLSLIKLICYPLNTRFTSKETNWGKVHEKDGLKEYGQEQNMSHEHFSLKNVGFCISPLEPYFGASPDSMVSCDCCGPGCVEVKCPYLLRSKSLSELSQMKQSFLKLNEDNISLDRDHAYYYQVQQQMAITNTQYCDFVVWSPSELLIERIAYDEDFWLCKSTISKNFHKQVIMPELLGKYFTKNSDSSLKHCICNSSDESQALISCGNENCIIVWYHLQCVGLSELPNYTWYCSSCS